MVKSRSIAWVLPCVVLGSTSLAAQEDLSPMPGARLRVTAPAVAPKPLVGTLVEVTERDLVLAVSDGERKAVPRVEMTRLQTSRGRRGNTVRGLLFGAPAGAALFATALKDLRDETSPSAWTWTGAAFGALVGAGIGALIKTEKWTDLPASNLHLTLAPVRGGGIAMGLRCTW